MTHFDLDLSLDKVSAIHSLRNLIQKLQKLHIRYKITIQSTKYLFSTQNEAYFQQKIDFKGCRRIQTSIYFAAFDPYLKNFNLNIGKLYPPAQVL